MAEVEKVVNPVILDDRKYFWNGVLAENILVSWGNCCVNGQNLNNIDLCCLNLFQKMTNYTFCFNEYRYKMCWKGEISQKIFCLWMRMTERKIFFPPLLNTVREGHEHPIAGSPVMKVLLYSWFYSQLMGLYPLKWPEKYRITYIKIDE